MPASVDLSFERFLSKPVPRKNPLCKPADVAEPPRYQPRASAEDNDYETDDLRERPRSPLYTSRIAQQSNVRQRDIMRVHRTIDEDYDGMDTSSDAEPVPDTPLSEGNSLGPHLAGAKSCVGSPEYSQDEGESVMDFDDPPTPSSVYLHPQEHPSIATIEDEERRTLRDDHPSNAGSPSASKGGMQRQKYRSYRDQHSTVPMPCLIDQCKHTSWMPKEREKHMDTHFSKRWQCGSCTKWYSTSYTLKRHSDSTHVPDACKGAYEAGNYASVPPYWTMPECVYRVRMPEPSDYLYSTLAPVFKQREDMLARGMLNKRLLPDDLCVPASESPKKRVKRKIIRQPVEPKHDSADESRDSSPINKIPKSKAEQSPKSRPSVMHPSQNVKFAAEPDRYRNISPEAVVPASTEKAREMCMQIWRAEHPEGALAEFEAYWAEATSEERLAYEMLYRARAKRNASKSQALCAGGNATRRFRTIDFG